MWSDWPKYQNVSFFGAQKPKCKFFSGGYQNVSKIDWRRKKSKKNSRLSGLFMLMYKNVLIPSHFYGVLHSLESLVDCSLLHLWLPGSFIFSFRASTFDRSDPLLSEWPSTLNHLTLYFQQFDRLLWLNRPSTIVPTRSHQC